MKITRFLILIFITGFLVFLITGCEAESDDIPTISDIPTVATLIEKGWEDFRNKKFENATTKFAQASERDALNIECLIGLGWSYSMTTEFTLARSNFEKAKTFSDDDNEILASCYAGLAGIELAENNFENAIQNIETTLQYDPDFELAQDPTINKDDLYLLGAEAYFEMEAFSKSCRYIQMLVSDFLVNSNVIEITDTLNPTIITEDDVANNEKYEYPTYINGIAILNVSVGKLVQVESIVNIDILDANISFIEMEEGGDEIIFFANPIPLESHNYEVKYKYAVDYGLYISYLSKKIEELRQQ